MNKEVDELINKQKLQLNKDKEKLQKNHTIFTNSFASTLGGMNTNMAQTERKYETYKGNISGRGSQHQTSQRNRY